MKIKLSVNRKAGAPGYGSDGAAAELEIDLVDDLVDTPEKLVGSMLHYYGLIEKGVDQQLERMQAKHPEPKPPFEPKSQNPENYRELREQQQKPAFEPPPKRSRPAPEPGWDEQDQRDYRDPEEQPPPARNGYGGRQQQRNGSGGGYGPPTSGSQLLAAAHKSGDIERLKALAKEVDRGPIKDWSRDLVDWAWDQLARPQPAGRWGGGSRN